jgi:hypothetical protein
MSMEEDEVEAAALVIAAGGQGRGSGGRGRGDHGGRDHGGCVAGWGRDGIPAGRVAGPVQTNWVVSEVATLLPKPNPSLICNRSTCLAQAKESRPRTFNPNERGRFKFTCCKRNPVWRVIARLIAAGVDHDVACDRVHQALRVGGHSDINWFGPTNGEFTICCCCCLCSCQLIQLSLSLLCLV